MYLDKFNSYKQVTVNSWTYNHKSLIVLLALIVVILVQNYSHKLPSLEFSNDVTVTNEVTDKVNCDYKCLTVAWTELRTKEIMVENLDDYRTTSRYQALLEANAMITEI